MRDAQVSDPRSPHYAGPERRASDPQLRRLWEAIRGLDAKIDENTRLTNELKELIAGLRAMRALRRVLIWIGALAAAVLAILELAKHFGR